MWHDVRNAALGILRTSSTEAQPEDLDRVILSTGYPWVASPAEHTSDLIAVYAANLRNGGGPGPGFEAFSKMIAWAVRRFIQEDRLQAPLVLTSLASACNEYLGLPAAQQLTAHGKVEYRAQLQAMATSRQLPQRALLPQLIGSRRLCT